LDILSRQKKMMHGNEYFRILFYMFALSCQIKQ